MSDATPFDPPKASGRIRTIVSRTFATVVVLLATIALIANIAGLVGVWIVRRPARDMVIRLSTFVDGKLVMIEQSLTRVSARAGDGHQALARVNDAVSKAGDRIAESSPLLTLLTNTVGDDLGPAMTEMRVKAAAIHDGVISLNAALETLDSLGLIHTPTLSAQLGQILEWVEAAQTNVEEMRAAIDQAKTGAATNFISVVTTRTKRIDTLLAHTKFTANKYQSVVAQKRQQVADLSQRLLRIIDIVILSLTVLFLIVAAGQLLLIHVCWQYVLRGRLPLLRAISPNLATQ